MQRYMLAAATLSAMLAIVPAFADENEFTMGQYLAATRCIAYADLRSLESDAPDVDALRAMVDTQARRMDYVIRDQARAIERDLRRHNSVRSEARLSELRERRDAVCAPFVERGLVQTPSPTGGA